MHSSEQHSASVVQGWMRPRQSVGLGAAATNEAAKMTATRRVDLKNCMLECGWIEKR